MRKEDLDWCVNDKGAPPPNTDRREIEICGNHYYVDERTACLAHAILLLCDSINDKDFYKRS